MKVISPVTITDAMLISSGVPEPDTGEVVWSAATAYGLNDVVYRATNHRKYRRLVAGTTATAPELDTTNWLWVGSTNRWGMFDTAVNSTTSKASPLVVTIAPGIVDSLAMVEVTGDSVTITMTDGVAGPTVYTTTVDLVRTPHSSWYGYFFEPLIRKTSLLLTDLPPYLNGQITITVTGTGTVAIGSLVVGKVYDLGATQYGASSGIRDYSKKTTDDVSGLTTLVQGKFAKIMRATLHLTSTEQNRINALLLDLRATACVWIGDSTGDIEPLLVFGFYRDFRLTIAFPTVGYYELEIEGMT